MILNLILSVSLFSVPMEPSVVEKNKNDVEIVIKAFEDFDKKNGLGYYQFPSSKDKSTLKSAKVLIDVCNKHFFTSENRDYVLSLKIAEHLSWLSGEKPITIYNYPFKKSFFLVSALDVTMYGNEYIKAFNTASPTTKKSAKKILAQHIKSRDYKDAKTWFDTLVNTGKKYGVENKSEGGYLIENFPPSQQFDFYIMCNEVDSFYGFYDKPSISGEALKIVMRSALHNTMSEYQKKYSN